MMETSPSFPPHSELSTKLFGNYILISNYQGSIGEAIREVLLRRSSLELCLNLGKVQCGDGRFFFTVLLRKVNFTNDCT